MKRFFQFLRDSFLLLTISGVIFGVFILVGYLSVHFFIQSPTVTLPYLHRTSLIEAMTTLEDLGMNGRVVEYRFDGEIPRNYIVEQYPVAGTSVKKNTTVQLVVSRGPEKVEVPRVERMELKRVRIVLQDAFLQMGDVTYMHSDSIPEGYVLRQSIDPGMQVPQETSIDLLVSSGEKTRILRVPDLAGKHLQNAQEVIEEMNLILDRVEYVPTDDYPPQTVIDQSPAALTSISEYSEISLKIAVPPSPYQLPETPYR